MIVKNEEHFLAAALRSVASVADEIVVVDTGSSDRTMEIARSFGASVFERAWRDDFAWARNEALALASKRWILNLDADEEVLPQSLDALTALKRVPAWRTGLWVRIHSRIDQAGGAGAMSSALIRIFPNDAAIRYRGSIHEFAATDESDAGIAAVPSPIVLVHHGYTDAVVERRNKSERNLRMARTAVEREPGDPYHWFNLGTTSELAGDHTTAREALERSLEILAGRPRGFVPSAYAILSDIYLQHDRDAARAEDAARQCLRVAPHHANGHFLLGKALTAQERYEEARDAFRHAIEAGAFADRQYVVDDQIYLWKAQAEIGRTFALQGDDVRALRWFDLALRAAPDAEPVRFNRERAVERLKRSESRQSVELFLEQGRHAAERGNFEHARSIARAGLASHPDDPGLQYARAFCELRLGDADAALAQLEAMAYDGSEVASAAVMLRAGILRDAGRTGDAAAVLDDAIARGGDLPALWIARAAVMESADAIDEQEAALRRAFECDPERAALPLASFLLAHGRLDEAAKVADRSLTDPSP